MRSGGNFPHYRAVIKTNAAPDDDRNGEDQLYRPDAEHRIPVPLPYCEDGCEENIFWITRESGPTTCYPKKEGPV